MSVKEGKQAAPKTVLTLLPYYEPGFKAGGPITTIRNSVDHLSDKVTFRIITSDRDLGDKQPYPIPLNRWIPGVPDRYYFSGRNGMKLLRLVRGTTFDVLYVNSFFSFQYAILPAIWNKYWNVDGKSFVLAPRGEFSEGALSMKPLKKKLFIALVKGLGIYSDIIWQASSVQEETEIVKVFGPKAQVIVAPDFPSVSKSVGESVREMTSKQRGSLRLVFLSRICRMKNVTFALSILRAIKGEVQFDIYGPIEDESYWEECCDVIQELPENIQVNYLGAVAPAKVSTTLVNYDLFILPTLGEGFGHAVLEALQAGCPVLISDRTPWGEVARAGAGMVISLDKPEDFALSLQRYVDMDDEEHARASSCAHEFSSTYMNKNELINAHLSLFE